MSVFCSPAHFLAVYLAISGAADISPYLAISDVVDIYVPRCSNDV